MISLASNLRVGVVRGSPDHGYDHSIASGRHILEKLPTKYRPVDIFIDTEGVWHIGGVPVSPTQALRQVDVVFNALHGAYTHEGGLARVCEREGVPYTGSGHLASSIAFNKELAKNSIRKQGMRTPLSVVVRREDNRDAMVQKVFQLLSGVLVVKPLRGSLQTDIRIVPGHFELPRVLEELLLIYEALLVEEYISGTEISIGVLENFRGEKQYVFVPLEIRKPRFGISREIEGGKSAYPAHGLTVQTKQLLRDTAIALHNIFNTGQYSQADAIVHPSGALYVIDFNTHPYLGRDGLFMKMLASVGARPEEFIETLLINARR